MAISAQSKQTRSKGFALVLALSMMAFVLLLLVSMTLLVQVETTNSNQVLNQLRANESARLALMMAIGDLQRYAGPDQRVTARAEILGSSRTTENPYWTGVWDTTNPSAPPRWMVSWLDQSTPPNASTLEIIAGGSVNTPSEYVTAPAIALSNPNGTITEEIAWSVIDEGIKASVGLIDNSDDVADGFFTDYEPDGLPIKEQRQIRKQLSTRRHRTEIVHDNADFIPGDIEDINDSTVASRIALALSNLGKVKSTRQLPILDGISSPEFKTGFHDLTSSSKALLSNTKLGGLKIDLSDQSYRSNDTGLPIDDNFTDFLWNSLVSPTSEIPLKGITQADLDNTVAGQVIHTTPALITEFALYFVVSGERVNSTTARAFLRFEAEVWSPYGFRHTFSGATSSATPEIFVEFESLPDIQLQFYDKDTDAFTSSTTLNLDQISPSFELGLTETHKSGEIRKSIGFWPINAGSDQSNFYYTDQWGWTITDPSYNSAHRRVSFPDGDSINYSSGDANISIVLKNASGDILQRIENIPIGSINTDFSYYEDSPSGLGASDAPIVFTYRMYSSKDDLEKWMTEIDPRSAVLDVSKPEIFELIDVNDVNGDGLGDADIPDTYFSNLDFFHGQANNNFFRLFDVPAAPPFSLGILQHIQIKDNPPFAIGNAWGGDLNNLFDRFFISGIPDNNSASYWDPDKAEDKGNLPNPFIEVIPSPEQTLALSDLSNSNSAQYLFMSGAFNVNSTSRKAWASVLSSNSIYSWDYALNRGTSSEENYNRLNLENAFFRLPFSGHLRSEAFTEWKFPFEDYELESDLIDDYPQLDDIEKELSFRNANGVNPDLDWRPSFSIGHREFSTTELEQLAGEIVDNLEARARPFISLEEFVNSGLLQQAIDQTSLNTIVDGFNYNDVSIDERIPRNASAYLSQADVISALGSSLTSRSDTFRIRASAKTLSRITGTTVASAHCEVIVQRLPERFDGQSSQTMNNATGFGREFLIENIIWLDSSQL